MPKVSKRQRIIKELTEAANDHIDQSIELLKIMKDEGYSNEDIEDAKTILSQDPVLEELKSVESNPYLGRRSKVPRRQNDWESFVDSLDEDRFKQDMCMSKASFEKILDLISGHRLYQKSDRGCQTDIRKQLMVVLIRLGSDSNAASMGRIARLAGISEGLVHDFTVRFFEFMMSMESDIVYWPYKEQKRKNVETTERQNGFPDCVRFVDGTLIHLAERPKYISVEWFNRKQRYSIQTIAVCDPDRRIIFFETGHLGCRNDSGLFGLSDVGKNLDKYFEKDDYGLGDYGYALKKNVIIPYRENQKGGFKREIKEFNYLHARARVSIENCFGVLKMRFCSLRNLPCCYGLV